MAPQDPRTWSLGTATSMFAEPGPADLAACAAAGITRIELDLFGRGLSATAPEGLARLTALAGEVGAAGLTLWSVHLPFGGRWDISVAAAAARRWAIDGDAHLLRLAATWGAGIAVIHASAEPVTGAERLARLEASQGALAELAAVAETAGITLAVECLPRTCLGNCAGEMLTLLQAHPALRVCCDVNHLFFESPADFVRIVAPRLATLHISDNDGQDERHWLPGRGVIDWSGTIGALAAAGYAGPFLFEVGSQTPADLRAAWERLLEALPATG